jgi:hypothetical protein
MCAGELGASRGGDEGQIDAEDLVHHRKASLAHLISPAGMAGGGRRNSAKATATRVARARGGVRVSRERGGRGRLSPTELDGAARVRLNPMGSTVRWAQGAILSFHNSK